MLSHWRRDGRMSFWILKHSRYIDFTGASIRCHLERSIFIRVLLLRASPEAIVHKIVELVLLLAFLLEIDLDLILVWALAVADIKHAVAALNVLERWLF